MMRSWSRLIPIAVFALAPVWSEAQGQLPPEVARHGYADMIVVNGKVITVDDGGLNQNPGSIHEAMAVKNDRVIALGTSERIRTLARSPTPGLSKGIQRVRTITHRSRNNTSHWPTLTRRESGSMATT